MEKIMKFILDFLKSPPHILCVFAFVSGVILFAPETILQRLHMEEFEKEYGFWIGLAFLTSISLLFVLMVKYVFGVIKSHYDLWRLKKAQIAFLMKLDDRKIDLIRNFIKHPTHTLDLPMNDGLVIELRYHHVISPAGNVQAVSILCPDLTYFLQPWVIERIKENEALKRKFNYKSERG